MQTGEDLEARSRARAMRTMLRRIGICVAVTICIPAIAGQVSATIGAATEADPSEDFPNGVAAGDVDQTSVVLWARAGRPAEVLFELATDWCFDSTGPSAAKTVIDPDIPAKVEVGGLDPGTQYFYRACLDTCPPTGPPPACDPASSGEARGSFRTPHADGANGLHFGVSSCFQEDLRPFASIQNVAKKDLDFFVAVGDMVYADGAASADEFRDEYKLAFNSRDGGRNVMAEARASAPFYATIDDHEVRDNFAGGAKPRRNFCKDAPNPCLGVARISETRLFENGLKAFTEYNPIAFKEYGKTSDARTAGKQRLYRYRTFGTDAALMVLDARSFRDEPVGRKYKKNKTMLGAAQLDDLAEDLQDARDNGITWKFVVVSVPIQNLGKFGFEKFESYSEERDAILDFIVSEGIENVVFISGDIHGTLVNNLVYKKRDPVVRKQKFTNSWGISTGPGAHETIGGSIAKTLGLKEQSDYEALDRVEQDLFMEQWLNDSLGLEGYPQVGLCGPGIPATLRRGSYLAVNSFGWTEFEIDAVTQNLTVTTYGIHRYDRDLYDSNQPNAILDERNPEVVSRTEVTPRTSSSARPVVGSLGDCATDCLPGAKCLASQDCCGSNVCDVAICVPRNSLSNGSPCSDDAACQSGVCDFAVCVPPNSVPDDYPCDDGAACQSGVCYLGLCGCQETLDACGDGGDCCHGYDVCNVHACVGRSSLPVFAPCNTHGACRSGSCTAGTCDQVCGDGDCDGVEQCGDDNSLFECNLDCERCDVGSLCQENSDCWTGYCTLGLCAPCLENQSLCLTDDQCCSGACSGVPLTCERLKGNGTRCVRDGQCSSGNCCNLRCRGCSCLGDPCSRDRDCCSNNCFLDRCAP